MPVFFLTNVGSATIHHPVTDKMVARFSKLDSIMFDIDQKMSAVNAGSGAYPVTTIIADRAPKVELKGVEINLGAYYRLLGAINTPAAQGSPVQLYVTEEHRIGSDGTVTLNYTPSTVKTTMDVYGLIDDAEFEQVASAPTQGQYSISGNTLTFNTDDAGKAIVVGYFYDSTTGGEISIGTTSIPGTWRIRASGKWFQNESDPSKPYYNINFVANSCQFMGNLQITAERQKASSQTLDLQILDPGDGTDPIQIITEAKYA
jgi:hypothetical protein